MMRTEPNILLVDDEERFANSLHDILSHYNYHCAKAYNGREAISLLKTNQFDLALLDVELPDMSGCDIAEFIKHSCQNTTSVMLTGNSTVETAVMAMKQGTYDFLSKPINHEVLIKTIEKALRHNQLTRELRTSQERFKILADASWEGIVIHDNGRLIEANNQFLSMFGYSFDELAGKMFLEKILVASSLIQVKRNIQDEVFGSHEIIAVRRDGTIFPAEVKSQRIEFLGIPARVCAIRDMSERIKAEEEKLELQRKLAKANKLEALGLMAGSVAHDLNNILSAIVSYPDLLLSQMDPADRYYREIGKIQEAGKRAAAVVTDLVVLARSGLATTTVENINEIILNHLNSIEHNERLARHPESVIRTSLQENLANTPCSPPHIHKILMNLIGNALEASGPAGEIRISTTNCRFTHPVPDIDKPRGAGDFVKITIADNGPGISKNDQDHIFDPFYSTKVMGKSGTGLGLAIVWNTVREHGGWIEVKDNNPGAAFEIYLPATEEKRSSPEMPGNDLCPTGRGEKILLIDDQPEQNETMARLLKSLGYTTLSAGSGEEGLALLKNQPVDLVLLDMMMGEGLNGRETYERILQIRPGQKAIIISGYAKSEDVSQARILGISSFLEKPVTRAQIGRTIKKVLAGE
jgi:two-component system, cell cycle sensor histidine kinase and response regulator CckA